MWNALTLQNGASPIMAQLEFFHDHILTILILILSLVGYWLSSILSNHYVNRLLLENQMIESIWTILPMFILIFIALPSLRLLYLLDEIPAPSLTIKVTGNQWFWTYEYSDFPEISFDSYMTSDLTSSPRLLDTDNHVTIPFNAHIRLLITASDVIHSWALPAAGIKVDAVPGRLNQVDLKLLRPGLFFGQCSEICGANHSFMPISVESVTPHHFLSLMN